MISEVPEDPTQPKEKTYIQGGVIPPGGTTHGSAASYLGGEILSRETLRRTQGIEFIMM